MGVIIQHTQARDGCDAPPEWAATCVFLARSSEGGGQERKGGNGTGRVEISHEGWLEAAGGMREGGKHRREAVLGKEPEP